MVWILWAVVFGVINLPIVTLLADRILAVPAPRVIRYGWLPGVVVLGVAVVLGGRATPGLLELLQWGAVGGALATVGLDVVRLVGHHVLRAFPADMPRIFGLLALGLGPRLQENMIASMVGRIAALEPSVQRTMLAERLTAMARLPEAVRAGVARAMRKGLSVLPEERRLALVQTQMALLAELPGPVRRSILRAMDLATSDGTGPPYAQPRGMPRIPMHLARELLDVALPTTAAEAGVSQLVVLLVGYAWHLLNGLGFGAAYTLLFGRGSWALAFGWGLFIWAGMMVLMPVMMPTIRFPLPRFLVVPFVAHVVMAVPIGYAALLASPAAHAASLVGGLMR